MFNFFPFFFFFFRCSPPLNTRFFCGVSGSISEAILYLLFVEDHQMGIIRAWLGMNLWVEVGPDYLYYF